MIVRVGVSRGYGKIVRSPRAVGPLRGCTARLGGLDEAVVRYSWNAIVVS